MERPPLPPRPQPPGNSPSGRPAVPTSGTPGGRRPQPPQRPDREDLETSRLEELGLAVRKWWWKASTKQRILALFGLFLLFGMITSVFSCDKPGPSKQLVQRAGGNKQLAQTLADAENYANSAAVVQSKEPDLRLTVTYQKDPQLLLVQAPSGTAAVDSEGTRWIQQKGCWKKQGSAPEPSAASVLLPLQESAAKFGEMSGDKIAYTTRQLGSWGAGSGDVILSKGKISEFTYRSDDNGALSEFKISYPGSAPLKNLDPKC